MPTRDSLSDAFRIQLGQGVAPEDLESDLELRQNVLPDVRADDLERLFGEETAEMILSANEGAWVGPHLTVRGQHWFRVTATRPPALLPLDVLRDQVRLDWIAEKEAARLEERIAELRARYRIVISDEGGEP